MERVRETENER